MVCVELRVIEEAFMQARFGIIDIPRSIESAQINSHLAEENGFDMVGVADPQSLFRELFVTLTVIGGKSETMSLGPTVTNPLTRHPAVMASGLASIQEVSCWARFPRDSDRGQRYLQFGGTAKRA